MILIRNECFRLTSEMKDWMRHPGRRDSRKMRAPGSIYFIGDGKRVKIGFAQHLAKRQSQLQTSSSRPLTLLGSIPGNRHVEQFLHWQFRKSRRQGEWFQLTGDLRSFIATHVTENASKTEIANVPQTSKRPRQKSVDLIEETPQEKHVLVQVV
jgi:hypothetical protein